MGPLAGSANPRSHGAMDLLQLSDLSRKAVKEVYMALHTLHGTIEEKNYPLVIRCFTHPPNVREQNTACRDRPFA